MKMHKLWTPARALPAANGRFTRRTPLHRRPWLTAAAASAAIFAFVAVATARNPVGNSEAQPSPEPPPYWAYAVNPPAKASHARPRPVDNTPRHVPGSGAAFTLRQINNAFSPPDWHPGGHPPMPEIVAHGSKPYVMACAFCHLPDGQGRPENASLAGLPAAYIVQQVADFKSGRRKTSNPHFLPAVDMASHETRATREEIETAAHYFSRLKPRPWIRVVETRTVPKTHVANWMLVPSAAGGSEPIGQRIVETPVNGQLTELRDDASGFIAYVPVGSVEKGKTLVTAGGAGGALACTTCHGPHLTGMGNAPAIAGRSPSYIVRQLYDFRSGARTGFDTHLMQPVAAKLNLDDMIDIAAYLASLHP